MLKNLYLIGGPMGVGKSSVCRVMQQLLPASVFLDGDWCWAMEPFVVNAETKAMVLDNICCLLNNFLRCSVYQNVIFCWVLHEQAIIDTILARLPLAGVRLYSYSLVCSEDVLLERLQRDIAKGLRRPDVCARSLERLPLYEALSSVKLDTSLMTAEQAARFLLFACRHIYKVSPQQL